MSKFRKTWILRAIFWQKVSVKIVYARVFLSTQKLKQKDHKMEYQPLKVQEKRNSKKCVKTAHRFFFTRLFSKNMKKLIRLFLKFENLPGCILPGFRFLEKITRLTFYPAFLIFWEITRLRLPGSIILPGCILPGFCRFFKFYPAAFYPAV